MNISPRLIIAGLILLSGCANLGPQRYAKGTSAETLMQSMGRPTGEYGLASGGRRLEYAGGTYGRQTFMFDFDPSDRLVKVEQVLTEEHFAAIKAGMPATELLAQIGQPSSKWPVALQRQTVWSYHYDSPFCKWFMVGMSPEGRVMDTAYGPDPLCESFDN